LKLLTTSSTPKAHNGSECKWRRVGRGLVGWGRKVDLGLEGR
jgi:hypothetical protein